MQIGKVVLILFPLESNVQEYNQEEITTRGYDSNATYINKYIKI